MTNDQAGTFTFSEAANPKVSFDKISTNEYVVCYDEKDVEIIFLHPPEPLNSFTWEKRKDLFGTIYKCDM